MKQLVNIIYVVRSIFTSSSGKRWAEGQELKIKGKQKGPMSHMQVPRKGTIESQLPL